MIYFKNKLPINTNISNLTICNFFYRIKYIDYYFKHRIGIHLVFFISQQMYYIKNRFLLQKYLNIIISNNSPIYTEDSNEIIYTVF